MPFREPQVCLCEGCRDRALALPGGPGTPAEGGLWVLPRPALGLTGLKGPGQFSRAGVIFPPRKSLIGSNPVCLCLNMTRVHSS